MHDSIIAAWGEKSFRSLGCDRNDFCKICVGVWDGLQASTICKAWLDSFDKKRGHGFPNTTLLIMFGGFTIVLRSDSCIILWLHIEERK